MIRKSFFATLAVAALCMFATPAQAQFKKLGKTLGKAAQEKGSEMALEMGATKGSVKIIEFMDQNNTIAAEGSEYAKRLKTIVGDKFTTIGDKSLDIKVYENDEANIIALHNGSIRIYSGMLDLLNDDEVKALLALQAAQIETGNVKDNLLKVALGENAKDAGAAQVEKMLAGGDDKIGSLVNELVQCSYTAEQNEKADKLAKAFLGRQGGSEAAYSALLSKIDTLGQVDLEADDLDEGDETVIKAMAASKFVTANKLR